MRPPVEQQVIEVPGLPPVYVTYLVRKKVWILVEDYKLDVELQDRVFKFHIRKGFRFDLASIPRILWSIISSFELSLPAPLIHDQAYRFRGRPVFHTPKVKITRKEADQIFLKIMQMAKVRKWKASAAYRAVRLFAPRW